MIGWFSFFFLKSLINDLIKPIGYSVSDYFFVRIETSASKLATLKARCNAYTMLDIK